MTVYNTFTDQFRKSLQLGLKQRRVELVLSEVQRLPERSRGSNYLIRARARIKMAAEAQSPKHQSSLQLTFIKKPRFIFFRPQFCRNCVSDDKVRK